MSAKQEAEQLARELYEARRVLCNAGRILHDEIGPLLSAAGLHLQADSATGALAALDTAMERVRALSQQLNASPAAHIGLEKALEQLVERHAGAFAGILQFSYSAGPLPPEPAAAVYDALALVLERAAADPSATRISISVRGTRKVTAQIVSNGRAKWPRLEWTSLARRAKPAGVSLDILTKRGTIVSIQYVNGRPPRG